jgi:hypothetical protein
MNRRIWACGVTLLCIFAMGCSKKADDQEAIRASIDKHLNESAGLNLSAMDTEVKQISVNGDHATAQVEFRLKEGDARMEIEYSLERKGKEWDVTKSEPIGGGASNPGSGGSNDPGAGHPPSN